MNFRSIIFIVLVLFSYVFFRVSPLKYAIVYKPHVTTHVFEKKRYMATRPPVRRGRMAVAFNRNFIKTYHLI